MLSTTVGAVLALTVLVLTARTSNASGICASRWQQCGGSTLPLPMCCEIGFACNGDESYMQCRPKTEQSSVPTLATPTPRQTPATACRGVSCRAHPFDHHDWYVNPSYRELLDSSIARLESEGATSTLKATFKSMQDVPSAYWIDVKSKIRKSSQHADLHTVEGILEDAAQRDPPQLVVFIVYDLPNRDCFALASNGEICCHHGENKGRTTCLMEDAGPSTGFYKEVPGAECVDGLEEYRRSYIDPFAEVLAEYTDRVPVVLVIEPDSLPNMVTNMPNERPTGYRGCHDESRVAYEKGIAYAVTKFAPTGATMYVDAGHGGWLGWANSDDDKAANFANIIASLNISDKIRGFATNVANYQPLGEKVCSTPGTCKGGTSNDPCCRDDPCGLQGEWNWGHNEVNYIDVLDARMRASMPGFEPKFIIDTGRNGQPSSRQDCGNWCNIRGSGIGLAPTSNTADRRIDAYFWLKTPGESDGCTEELPDSQGICARFDKDCASKDSIGSSLGEPRAPEAGLWFHHQIKELAANAVMGEMTRFQARSHGDGHGLARPASEAEPIIIPTVLP